MDLALFDFDGTITTKGTYPGFVRFAVPPVWQLAGGLLLSPLIAAYYGHLVSDQRIRHAMSRVGFWRAEPARVRRLGEAYAHDVLPRLIRPQALERIGWHQARGDRVVVVSASLDVYLEPWCRTVGVEVICTELEVRGGRLTGRYAEGDCCGAAKGARIRARYALDQFDTIYAYGDTEEDREMLVLAHRRFFRWEEIADLPAAGQLPRRGDGGI